MKKFICKMKPEEVTKLLQEGKVIKDLASDAKYKLLNGLLYNSKYRSLSNALFLDDEDLYFETEEPFKIKETGFYKTRDGRKAFVSYVEKSGLYPVSGMIEGSLEKYSWTKEGYAVNYKKLNTDIVSKWED